MPLYEYYCRDCNGVFELLRPTREASKAQSCPECDADSERIMSKEWAAFVFREGYPRRIPDDGSYWHMGKKVSHLITGSTDGYTHPELKRPDPEPEPTVADVEEYEIISEVKLEREREFGGMSTSEEMGRMRAEKSKVLRRKSSNSRVEAEKRRVAQKVRAGEREARRAVQRELEGRIVEAEKRNKKEIPPPDTT